METKVIELIGRISRGSRMDQIYLPKNRINFSHGSYVTIRPLDNISRTEARPVYYNVARPEPVKVWIINEIFKILNDYNFENFMIIGSFFDNGFGFNDIDILIISDEKIKSGEILNRLKSGIGGPGFELIKLSNKELAKGLATDPMWGVMLSRFVAKKRIIHKPAIRFDCRLLDLILLKSRLLIDNYDSLSGDKRYKLVRNLVALDLFIRHKERIGIKKLQNEIKKQFGDIQDIKSNQTNKDRMIKKYKLIYNHLFKIIMNRIKNGSKQE